MSLYEERLVDKKQSNIVITIVTLSLIYQIILCFINTKIFNISTAIVALFEFAIYALLVFSISKKIPKYIGLMLIVFIVNFAFCFLIRGALDPKGIRDYLIIILFFWFGYTAGNETLVNKLLLITTSIVLIIGLFEWLALDLYTQFFNTFNYYVNQSGIGANGGAIFEGQALTLNGFRPDGIGRTILPFIFGSHRISSVFLEPVSLGNYAVILFIWSIAKDKLSSKIDFFIFFSSFVLIAFADSRFGLLMFGFITVIRYLLPIALYGFISLFPIFVTLFLMFYAYYYYVGAYEDTFMGRLLICGSRLVSLTLSDFFGFQSPLKNYGDMGYPYIISRFGILFILFNWISLWLIPLTKSQNIRIRGFCSIYISLILTISGSSLFALKTASILWFIVGCAMSYRNNFEKG